MIRHTIAALIAALVLLAAWSASAAAAESRINGTATISEPIPLPRHAVFEAVLEDVSRADAPAVELGRVEIIGPGSPPYNFSIGFDSEAIDGRRIYAVRAAIRIDGRLAFASDTFNPVLTRGAPEAAEVGLVRVGRRAAPGLGRSRSVGLAALAPPRPVARPAQVAQAPADPAATPHQLRGFVTFMAEAARFTDCATGTEYPVDQAGDYAALEHAYVAAGREPGGPVMVSFEGAIVERPTNGGGSANAGTEPVVRVDRFVGVWADEACEAAVGNRPLVETRWRFLRLGGAGVDPGAGGELAHLFFQAGAGGPRFTASAGCNTLAGGFEIEGERLVFGRPATTLMACPPPLADRERRLGEALGAARGWRIDGDRLALLGGDGAVIAELVAAETE